MVDLPRAERELGGVRVRARGRSLDFATMLDETYADGILVLHDGVVLHRALLQRHGPVGAASADVRLEVT